MESRCLRFKLVLRINMYKGAAEMAHIKLLSKEINENIINGLNAGRKFSWTYSTIFDTV